MDLRQRRSKRSIAIFPLYLSALHRTRLLPIVLFLFFPFLVLAFEAPWNEREALLRGVIPELRATTVSERVCCHHIAAEAPEARYRCPVKLPVEQFDFLFWLRKE